ncbi:aminoacyl-tRNA hydrolase, partial [Vibrio anguillarum]|nr:aminoacyl-tRNA hydrolase [Vibrio anguillarum]
KPRRATKPTKSSQRRRVDEKKRIAANKSLRGKVSF